MTGDSRFTAAAGESAEADRWPWGALPEPGERDESWPKISLVVPNYNYGRFLDETLRSIVLQGYPNLELIVMDGGSTDDSVEIIRRFEGWIDYWESEPDRGQAHAINKGLSRVSGSIVNWVNSDDTLLPGSLRALAEAHRQHPEAILAGDVIFRNEQGQESRLHQQNLSFETIADPEMKTRWMQPGIFVPTALLSGQGDLDESLRFQFDRDWMLALSLKAPIICLDEALIRFRIHAEQRSLENMEEFFREGFGVMERYAGQGRLTIGRIRAFFELSMAALYLGDQPHFAPYWNRYGGIRRLLRAIGYRPGLFFSSRYLKLLRRALLPKFLYRSGGV